MDCRRAGLVAGAGPDDDAHHRVRRGVAHIRDLGCGRALQTARFEYTGAAFANPFKRVFAPLYRPVRELDIRFHPESRMFVETITYRDQIRSIFEEALYGPIVRLVQRGAQRARIVQSGNVHLYLVYIFAALVALLALAG
ncbi:MAG: hypothetical protein M5R38_14060 [Candidatus Methylomirabilis sp.]|nr:hypothetical protein [Candidatus Methylomirabilis sp.]